MSEQKEVPNYHQVDSAAGVIEILQRHLKGRTWVFSGPVMVEGGVAFLVGGAAEGGKFAFAPVIRDDGQVPALLHRRDLVMAVFIHLHGGAAIVEHTCPHCWALRCQDLWPGPDADAVVEMLGFAVANHLEGGGRGDAPLQ